MNPRQCAPAVGAADNYIYARKHCVSTRARWTSRLLFTTRIVVNVYYRTFTMLDRLWNLILQDIYTVSQKKFPPVNCL